jgi:hypothetical protein
MKKVIMVSVLIVFLLMAVYACGSTRTCPAYGHNNTEQLDNQNG